MKSEINEISVNGVAYVRKDSASNAFNQPSIDGLPLVLIRTFSAGVHFGYLKSRTGKEVELLRSRRIWQWVGASELCQVAVEGVKSPDKCKISVEVPSVILTEAIEVLPISQSAQATLDSSKPWKH